MCMIAFSCFMDRTSEVFYGWHMYNVGRGSVYDIVLFVCLGVFGCGLLLCIMWLVI